MAISNPTNAGAVMYETGQVQGRNLVEGYPFLLTNYEVHRQTVGGGDTFTANGTVHTQGERDAEKVLLWMVPLSQEALDNYDPRDPNKGAELFHTWSGVIRRQIEAIGHENLPAMIAFRRSEVADGRTDIRDDRPFTAWSVDPDFVFGPWLADHTAKDGDADATE